MEEMRKLKVNHVGHSRVAERWLLKARSEVMDRVEKLKDIDKEKYLRMADEVVVRHTESLKKTPEVIAITKEIKAAWPRIQKVTKRAKKVSKKFIKKIS